MLESGRSTFKTSFVVFLCSIKSVKHQCHGRPDLAFRFYNDALEVARETGEPQLLFPCYDGLATLHLDRDEMSEAERYFGLAQDLCARHGLDPGSLVALPFLD